MSPARAPDSQATRRLLFTRNPFTPRTPIAARLYLQKHLVKAARISIASFRGPILPDSIKDCSRPRACVSDARVSILASLFNLTFQLRRSIDVKKISAAVAAFAGLAA